MKMIQPVHSWNLVVTFQDLEFTFYYFNAIVRSLIYTLPGILL